MILTTADEKMTVDIGTSDTWKALYSTIVSCIENSKEKYPRAIQLLETGKCISNQGYESAREFNHIRDELSNYKPDQAVYDIDNPELIAPWKKDLSPVITSCANLFVTADGKDLLFEIVSILCYAEICKVNILSMD